jgi:AraC-like DNA-binding protein
LNYRFFSRPIYPVNAGVGALRKAADLLAHAAERRISDIAFACRFNDLSYFNRCFRRRFGLTPTAALIRSDNLTQLVPRIRITI